MRYENYSSTSALLESNLPLPLYRHGKVRDVYELGGKFLILSSDRVSAFDVILPCGIPGKGKILNQLSAFWFQQTQHIISNHLITVIDDMEPLKEYHLEDYANQLIGRAMIVTKTIPIPIEGIVRGYLSGSAWEEYHQTGAISGTGLPSGLQENQQLPYPLFTPTTKSDTEHDRPLTRNDIKNYGIGDIFAKLKNVSLMIYDYAQNYAKARGIIIADTKFEFGRINDTIMLIDELLTPDSSRFWDSTEYKIGHPPISFDKQPVRDWVAASGWNKQPPAPALPPTIIKATTTRYNKIYQLLIGKSVFS